MRLYARSDEGALPNAVIVFDKQPYYQKTCGHGEKGHTYISKYAYRCTFDLWVLKLRLDWVGRERKPDHSPYGED